MNRVAPPQRLAALREAVEVAVLWCAFDPSELRRRCRVLLEVDASVLNGGIGGLVGNPSGDLVPEAIIAADELGATRAADSLREVERLVGKYPTDLPSREAVLESLPDDVWSELDDLTDRWPSDEILAVLRAQIDASPEAFWSHPKDHASEMRCCLDYLTSLVGAALFGDAEAEHILTELAAWSDTEGSAEDRSRVASELRRLASLRR